MTMRSLLAVTVAALLSGCAYSAAPISTGAVNVVTSYGTRVPGRYALFVDGTEFNKTIRPRGLNCAAHTYPLQMSDGLTASVQSTLSNLVEQVELTPVPLDGPSLRSKGYAGLITVRAENLDGKLIAIEGFWGVTISTTVQLTASVSIDSPSGRLAGRTLEGIAEREADAGAFCSGGAESVEDASRQALRKLMVQLGEAVANSDRVRVSARR